MRTRKITLALSLLSTALLATAPAHVGASQNPLLNPHLYALPQSVVGGTLRLVSTKRHADGSVTYMFKSTNPAGRSGMMLLYSVNAGNSSAASAQASSLAAKIAMGQPFLDGVVTPHQAGIVWSDSEFGDETCRITVGYAYHRAVAIINTMNARTDDCSWANDYTAKIATALIRRLP